MKSILLCAGYATRLYPLTLNKAKSLLKVAGKPMIEHILEKINVIEETDEIFIVTNDKFYEDFVEWSLQFNFSKKITVLNDGTTSNETRLGAVGDIEFAIKHGKIDDDILVVGGDNLFEFDLSKLNDFFLEKASSVVALYDVKDLNLAKKYGIVSLDSDSKIVQFLEKPSDPPSTLASTACYIFSKEDIDELKQCMKENKKPDNLGDFIRYLSNKKDIYGYVFTDRWFDIGSHEELKHADKMWGKK